MSGQKRAVGLFAVVVLLVVGMWMSASVVNPGLTPSERTVSQVSDTPTEQPTPQTEPQSARTASVTPQERAASISFVNVSRRTGVYASVRSDSHKYGLMWGDFDRSGAPDLVYLNHPSPGSAGGDQPILYNPGNRGGVTDRQFLTPDEFEDQHGAACADYDNDGDLDIYTTVGGNKGNFDGYDKHGHLYRQSNGSFVDLGPESGIRNRYGRARTPTWIDYDQDGRLDLFVGNLQTDSVMYRNTGNSTFENVTAEVGIDPRNDKIQRGAWSDYDRDGDPDLLTVRPVALYENENGSFDRKIESVGLSKYQPGQAQAISWGDYNSDGYPDVFITSKLSGNNTLYENDGDGTFTRVEGSFGPSEGAKGFGAEWVDVDNDGDLDLVVTETNTTRLFENRGGELVERPFDLGVRPGKMADIAFEDYDGDGRLDLAMSSRDEQLLFANRGSSGNWLRFEFDGTQSNRMGMGANVFVDTGTDVVHREYTGDTGTLFSTGCGPLHVGVGNAESVDVRVVWPSGSVTRYTEVSTNQTVTVAE